MLDSLDKIERSLRKVDRWLLPSPQSKLAPDAPSEGLLEFIPRVSPHLEAPTHLAPVVRALEKAEREPVRVIISTPPQHGKSTIVLHSLVWWLLRNPRRRHAYVTYAAQFARDQMYHASLLAHNAGLELVSESLERWRTAQGGGVVATGIGGPLTGYAVDGVLVVDDYVKNRRDAESATYRQHAWSWFTSTAMTRVHPGASIVIVATRWHPDDLAGRLIKDGWEWISLPAIGDKGEPLWPKYRPLEWLEQQRRQIGEYEWQALYMCQPREREGATIRREWLRVAEPPPAETLRISLGVDLAISQREGADYTAIVAVGRDREGRVWVLDSTKARLPFHQTLQLIQTWAARWHPERIAIEAVQYQAAVIQELLRTTTLPVYPAKPDRDKLTRFLPLAARYEQGLVWHAPNLPREFEDELLGFPLADHDDQVDALIYAWGSSEVPTVRPQQPTATGRAATIPGSFR